MKEIFSKVFYAREDLLQVAYLTRNLIIKYQTIIYIIMKDRIHQILDWTNLSQQDFANRLGISPASLSSIFTGRTNPTNNHVQAIHRAFPEINVSWLLFGEGNMMENLKNSSVQLPDSDGFSQMGESAILPDSGSSASSFHEDDLGNYSSNEATAENLSFGRREINYGKPTGFQFVDNAKKIDIRQRKIKEIRVFFDDGTYEAFVPSGGK